MAGGPQDQVRLARDRNDGEQTATRRDVGLAAAARRFRHLAVVVMLMRRSIGMHVHLAAVVVYRSGAMIVRSGGGVVVHGNSVVAFDQAMGDAGTIGEGECCRWCENAKRIERGQRDRRFHAEAFGRHGQHCALQYPPSRE